MNTLKSVSSLVTEINGTRKRSVVAEKLTEVNALLSDNPLYSGIESKLNKLIERVENKEISLKKVCRRLDKHVVRPLEVLSSGGNDFSDDASITRGLASAITRTLVFTFRGDKLDGDDIVDRRAIDQSGIRTLEELKYYRHFFNAPVVHARQGLMILNSILGLPNSSEAKHKLLMFMSTKGESFTGDIAVKAAYHAALGTLDYTGEANSIRDIVNNPHIQTDKYALEFFTRKNFGTDDNINVRAPYGTVNEIKSAIKSLRESYNELVTSSKITITVSKLSQYYITKSNSYKLQVAEASSQASEELRDYRASNSLLNVRDKYRDKFSKRVPTKFSEAAAYTLKVMPVEAELKNFRLRDEKALAKFGIKANSQQFTKLKKDSSIFYENQVVLFFDRNIIKDLVTEIIEEGLDENIRAKTTEAANIRSRYNDKKKLLRTLQTRLAKGDVNARETAKLNSQIMEITEELAKLEQSVKTVNQEKKALARSNEQKRKSLLRDPARVFELGMDIILRQINANTSSDYELFATTYPRNPKAPRSSMAWLMETDRVRSLRATFGDVSVKSWNLPWVESKTKTKSV